MKFLPVNSSGTRISVTVKARNGWRRGNHASVESREKKRRRKDNVSTWCFIGFLRSRRDGRAGTTFHVGRREARTAHAARHYANRGEEAQAHRPCGSVVNFSSLSLLAARSSTSRADETRRRRKKKCVRLGGPLFLFPVFVATRRKSAVPTPRATARRPPPRHRAARKDRRRYSKFSKAGIIYNNERRSSCAALSNSTETKRK